MSKVILVGDSHSDLFRSIANIDAYNLKGRVLTAQRFVDKNFQDIWSSLDPWLQARARSNLILCVNEIDIRGHYWRHIPRSNQSVKDQVANQAQLLFSRLEEVLAQYSLNSILLWGVPPACNRTLNNHQWPFVGSVETRNRLIHIFNRSFCKLLKPNSRIKFATAFYKYLDSKSWLTVNHRPTDGVHWDVSQRDLFYSELVQPLLGDSDSAYLIFDQDLFSLLPVDFTIKSEAVNQSNCLYDSWVNLTKSQVPSCLYLDQEYFLWTQRDLEGALHLNYRELQLS